MARFQYRNAYVEWKDYKLAIQHFTDIIVIAVERDDSMATHIRPHMVRHYKRLLSG